MAGRIEHRLCTVLAFIFQINCISLATDCDKDICPYDKPFCTEVGCVFKCPEIDYVNGSTCVTSCGSMFVDKDRTCRIECPSDKYISESIVRIGKKHVKEKNCLDNCFQLVYNRTCLPACPLEARYIHDNKCVEKCPPNSSIVYLESTTNVLKCSAQCLHPNVFEDDICVRECTKYNFVLNNTCVNACPKDTALIEVQSKTIRKTCTKDCNSRQFIRNGTCMESCPKMEFIHNKTCVSVCPPVAQYIYKHLLENYNSCVPTCPRNMYILGKMCVRVCPGGMVVQHRTCKNQCPTELPFIFESSIPFESTYLKKCSSLCPKYIFNHTCTNRCPNEARFVTGLVNETCIQSCPHGYNFRRHNITDAVFCLRKCDHEEFVYNTTCFPNCPTAANYAFTNRSCTSAACPGMYMYNVLGTINCVLNCPPGHSLVSERFCVKKCPKHQIRDKTECVNQCPLERPFTDRGMCSKTCSTETHMNMTCVDRCPFNMKYTGKDHRCLNKCPENTRSTQNGVCSDTCGEDEILLVANKSCIFFGYCNMPKVIYDNQCIDQCPYLWDENGHCSSFNVFIVLVLLIIAEGISLIALIICSRIWIVSMFEILYQAARTLITKVCGFDMSHFDTNKNRGSPRIINTKDRMPLLDVSCSYAVDDNDDHGHGWQSGSNDLITAHGNNELVDNESEI